MLLLSLIYTKYLSKLLRAQGTRWGDIKERKVEKDEEVQFILQPRVWEGKEGSGKGALESAN